jgi:hypothetical protein
MPIYKIGLKEHVKIEADSEYEALEQFRKQYREQDIISISSNGGDRVVDLCPLCGSFACTCKQPLIKSTHKQRLLDHIEYPIPKRLTLAERAVSYNTAFAKFSAQAPMSANDEWYEHPLIATKRWLIGVWMIGNDYRNKRKYYGQYPPTYLRRIMWIFPDCTRILHLFSGSLTKGDIEDLMEKVGRKKGYWVADRFDLNEEYEPEFVGEALDMATIVPTKRDLIIADPPYSEEDAQHYGKCLVNRNKVVKECYKVLKPGGFLVWLDQVEPMYRKDKLNLCGTINVIRSTNHRVRDVFIWEKISTEEWK